jgi:hypothetical protein
VPAGCCRKAERSRARSGERAQLTKEPATSQESALITLQYRHFSGSRSSPGESIASIYALGGSDPDPIWSQHGISRLIEGAVGGALIYIAAHRALSRKK